MKRTELSLNRKILDSLTYSPWRQSDK